MERSGVIIAIEFCGYPRQTRTIWSAHPTAEYLSGICLMHKQFPCRRRHRQLPIITHLRSRGWTIVVSREQTRFSSPFQILGEDREPTHLEERSSPPRGGKFCSYGGGRRIERKGGRGEIEIEREREGREKRERGRGGSCTIAFVTVASRESSPIYPRPSWRLYRGAEVGDIRPQSTDLQWSLIGIWLWFDS